MNETSATDAGKNVDSADVYFDADDLPEVELDGVEDLDNQSIQGLEKLADLGVLKFETDSRDGNDVVTNMRFNLRYLSTMATEFHVVERRYGERWGLGSWDPDIRILDDE